MFWLDQYQPPSIFPLLDAGQSRLTIDYLQGFEMLPSDMKLLIRADASPQIGTGYVTRCLSLAKAWKAIGGQTAFVCGDLPEILQQTIAEHGFQVYSIAHATGDGADSRETGDVAIAFEPDWIVLDGDRFDDSYQSKLRSLNVNLMVIDDTGYARNAAADLIVKQSRLSRDGDPYSPTSTEQILNGPDFFLVRDGSQQPNLAAEEKHIVARVRRILITMGEAESNNISLRILETLSQQKSANLIIDLVVAADYPHIEELCRIKKETSLNLRCHRNFDRTCGLTDRIDLVITSAEASCLELARQGCPAILLSTSDNQIPLAEELDRLGVAINAGSAVEFDSKLFMNHFRSVSRNAELRCQMSNRGPQVVDGQGAARIARRLAASLFELRTAQIPDAIALHAWRNEPEYRALSFSPKPISLAAHHTWLERKLKSSDSMIWIASDKLGTSIGTIAIDSVDRESVNLAICLCPTQRGRGLGPILIEKASTKLLREYGVDRILVQFKPGNTASQHAFKKAGYRPIAPTTVNGFTALQMVLERTSQGFSGQSVRPLRKSA